MLWFEPVNVTIPEVTSSYPAADIWREMAAHVDAGGEDEWLHELAKIKTIMGNNERQRQGQNTSKQVEKLKAKVSLILSLVEKQDTRLDETIQATQNTIQTTQNDLAAKMDDLTKMLNHTAIDRSLGRLKTPDTDLTQTIAEAQDALVASRQALVRSNGIMNDL